MHVAPEVNLRELLTSISAKHEWGCPLWLWNPVDTFPEVQNRDISGPIKRTYVLQIKKKDSQWRIATLHNIWQIMRKMPAENGTLDGCIWLTEEQAELMLEDTVAKMEERRHGRKKRTLDKNIVLGLNRWDTRQPIKWKFDNKHSTLTIHSFHKWN